MAIAGPKWPVDEGEPGLVWPFACPNLRLKVHRGEVVKFSADQGVLKMTSSEVTPSALLVSSLAATNVPSHEGNVRRRDCAEHVPRAA